MYKILACITSSFNTQTDLPEHLGKNEHIQEILRTEKSQTRNDKLSYGSPINIGSRRKLLNVHEAPPKSREL